MRSSCLPSHAPSAPVTARCHLFAVEQHQCADVLRRELVGHCGQRRSARIPVASPSRADELFAGPRRGYYRLGHRSPRHNANWHAQFGSESRERLRGAQRSDEHQMLLRVELQPPVRASRSWWIASCGARSIGRSRGAFRRRSCGETSFSKAPRPLLVRPRVRVRPVGSSACLPRRPAWA